MNHKLKQKAIELRIKHELSYSAIKNKLGVPKSTLSNWLINFPLSKERVLELKRKAWKKNEAKYELYRITMREKKEKREEEYYNKYKNKLSNFSQNSYFIAGLALYLAEGSKRSSAKLVFTNTNSKLVIFFIYWINKFFKFPKEKIRIFLQLYPNMDIEKELFFWEKELKLPRQQFYKPFIRKLLPSSFSYRESFHHGTCAAIVMSAEKHREVLMACKAFLDVSTSGM
ncbi:MAG: hypothetical protein HYT63_02425 [Candidatus Yanofskybacteria bacterium]|nr:hypothetical protein [Candidatus Yanofskybacteria bacterium]